MSDAQIREILKEEKKQKREMQRRARIREEVEGYLSWGGLFFIGFMLFVIGA